MNIESESSLRDPSIAYEAEKFNAQQEKVRREERGEKKNNPAPYERRIARIREKSREALAQIIDKACHPWAKEAIIANKDLIDNIRTKMGISINTTAYSLRSILQDGEYRSSEPRGLMNRLLKSPFFSLANRTRVMAERKLEIRPSGLKNDPPLVYGSTTYGDKENIKGGAPLYGNVVIKLNFNEVKERTTFTITDSFSPFFSRDTTTYEEAPVLKFLHQSKASLTDFGYTEAQIAGGVRLKDIQEIVFPISSDFDERWLQGTLADPKIKQNLSSNPHLRLTTIDTRDKKEQERKV